MSQTTPMPAPITRLPRDKHSRSIPWFVHIDDEGAPDFRIIGRDKLLDAWRFSWCWVCGKPRGKHAAFVIGPMCGVNRVSAEPPSHLECAVYSARACPFLTTPTMVRRERGLDEIGTQDPAGLMLTRNPGVALVWSSRTWVPFRAPGGGVLFNVGEPTATRWYAHGRTATRAEVLASIETGLPLLREQAEAEGDRAVAALERMHADALTLVPA